MIDDTNNNNIDGNNDGQNNSINFYLVLKHRFIFYAYSM